MTAQTSLDAQLETGNSPFADFTQFPESSTDVSLRMHKIEFESRFKDNNILFHFTDITKSATIIGK